MRILFPLVFAALTFPACSDAPLPLTDADAPDVATNDAPNIIEAGADVLDGDIPTDLGWTQFHGLPGTTDGYLRAIYVDAQSGSDANDGLSPSTPLQHIDETSKLFKMLKAGGASSKTMVLLKPGSEWTYELLQIPAGGTTEYPLLVSGTRWPNAGSTRPKVRLGVRVYSPGVSHVAIEGLEIGPRPAYIDAGTQSSIGIDINEPGGTDFLVEDCLITRFFNLIVAMGNSSAHVSNVRVRRNYLFGAYGSGAVVAFDGNDVDGALFEENFFDYNGGPKGDYENPSLVAPYSNALAHDVYFADDGTSVVAFNVKFHRNLFARTLLSMKGPYSGDLDDNLFYNYWDGGYVGTWGTTFQNNVLVNGAGFSAGLDNGHDPNTDPNAMTRFCNNLEYNEKPSGTAFQSPAYFSWPTGVNLQYDGNVIDGFDSAFEFRDKSCFGYSFTNNVVSANKLYTFGTTPQCAFGASGNAYWVPQGESAQSFATLESSIHESDGTNATQAFTFTEPTRNISSYLVHAGLATADSSPTLIDYLKAIRAQADVPHTWSAALDVANVNAYLRDGHSRAGKPLAYRASCP
jgi:hypothetical protein